MVGGRSFHNSIRCPRKKPHGASVMRKKLGFFGNAGLLCAIDNSACLMDHHVRLEMSRLTDMLRIVLAIVCLCLSCGCGDSQDRETACVPPTAFEPKTVETELPGLHNVLLAADGIYSGSEPHGEEAFAGLAKMGIKTILSVDGARPDVELARQHGLRYVHVPIGYDGISPSAGETLAAAAREAQGPLYVHCHHGKHRGPSATAVI